MSLTEDERILLELGEEDYTGINEAFFCCRDHDLGSPEEVQVERAKEFLSRMLCNGWIAIYEDDLAASTETKRVARQLTPQEVQEAFAIQDNWTQWRIRGKVQITFGTTEKGTCALERG